jgi:hypothetical protein
MNLTIRSGGQTGVDRAALDFAIGAGLRYAGWCPLGGWAEDYPDPPGLLVKYPRFIETPSPLPGQRTDWNVRDSDATLIVTRDGEKDLATSSGTGLTRICADQQYGRPWCLVGTRDPSAVGQIASWLRDLAARMSSAELVLNVAGPRESGSPGIYAETLDLLHKAWKLTER